MRPWGPLLMCLAACITPSWSAHAKHINVATKPSWNSTSLLVEASEFFGSISSGKYWAFIDALQAELKLGSPMTDEGEYTLALKAAGNFCGAATMSSLKFSLGIRNYSPAAELHRQLFREEVGEKDIDRLVGCAGVVAVGGELVCVTAENAKAQIKEAFATTSMQRAEEFDHVWPGASGTSAVILYAQLSSLSFANLHTAAVENAFETGLAYVLRPLVPLSSDSFNLQGFGVELAIKSMEYKVIDDTKIEIGADDQAPSVSELLGEEAAEQDVSGFYFDKLLSRRPDLGTDLNTFRESLLAASVEDSKSIKAWDMKNLGTQAAQVILRSKDPLLSLRDIAQNFPMYATSLTRLRVNTTVEQVLKKRGDRFDPNRNLLFINGQQLDLAKLDIFEMHALLKRDAAKNDLLAELHLPTEARVAFRSLRIAEETGGKRVDMGLRKKAEKAVPVIWLNNIEKDAAYKQWGKSVSQLLQPSWGGQLKYIRKNLFNVVLTFDPATAAGLEVFDKIQFFAENQAPLRCALAFVIPSTTSTSDPWPADILPKEEWKEFIGAGDSATPETFDSPSALIVKLFSHVVEEHEVKGGVQWLRHLHELDKDFKDVASVERAFTAFYPMLSSDSAAKVLKDVLGGDFHKELTRMQEYLLERGLGGVGESPKIVLNGIVMSVPSTDMLQQLLVRGLSNEQTVAAEMVQRKQINDKSNFAKAFEKRPDVVSRLGSNVVQTLEKMVVMNALPAVPKLHYMHGQGEVREFGIKAATVWCVVDLGSAKGLRLAMAAVEQLYSPGTRNADPSVNSRLAIIHNPVNGLSGGAKLAAFLNTLASRVSSTKALPVMRQALALVSRLDPNAQNDIALLRVLNLSSLSEKVKAAIAKAVVEAVTETAGSAAKFEVAAGDSVLILNGRVLTFGPETTLAGARADLDTLIESFYASMRGRELVDLLSQTSFDEMDPDAVTAQWVDDVALRLSFTLLQEAKAGSAGGAPMPVVSEDEAMVRHRVEKPGVRVWAVLNPLSQDAQKLAPFLVMLRDAFEADVTVVLNPHKTVAEFPLKRFYRYAVTSSLTFDTLGAVRPAPGVVFRDLVTQSLLTLTMDMPESWRVAAESCPYDLDNIRLSEIKQDALTAVFRLKNLLISGQCYEEGGQPPAGLQLDLGRGSEVMADTLVMANLGYFQLQANPGAWKLSLHGAANTVYSIDGGSLAQGDKHESRRLFVKAFDEGLRMLDVIRRPGQEVTKLEDLTMVQAPAASKGGFLSSLWNGGASKEVVSASTDETVHIFSVASGHLYERFLKIMMLSVVKNTKSPVKFWFIENFFSPQFKDFAPKMAEKYGYEIEFVTYKWPAWLRRQTEKQRVIWGYKILFLDVLFPLDLKRIIYIDADQVIRGDVQELNVMDLHGAPYAYTPFCLKNANKDTLGFRFWDSGFWKEHLRGSPYHISALYVVDLIQFRKMRAGDTLRMIYSQLSQDPNSLSNLDQDLPNYAQSMVPIHSLPETWLWCQAWCSMDSLPQAKTIDLCNNPQTKRPKLEVARELLPEWELLDEEASNLTASVLREHGHSEL